ncbi:unnamed protein product [Amaranthus hypochondriacus]
MWVLIDSDVNEELLSFVRCLRVSELVGCDCVMQYLPHRVGMQFGMDQDIPSSVTRSNAHLELAWASYSKPVVEKDIGDNFTRASSGSSLERMASQKPQNVFNEIASNTMLNPLVEREDVVNAKGSKNVVNEIAENTVLNLLNEQEDAVNAKEPQNVVKELNPLKGSHSPSMKVSSVVHIEGVNVKVVSIGCTETEELCSEIGEDNYVGKDAMEVVMSVTKQAYNPSKAALVIEEGDDEAPDLTLECRMKTLERLVSMYKEAKFGSTA